MTESEWLTSEDPAAMLRFVTRDGSGPGDGPNRSIIASDRKLRQWVIACRDREQILKPGCFRQDDDALKVSAILRTAASAWCGPPYEDVPGAERAAILRDIVGDPFLDLGLMVRDGRLYRRVSRGPSTKPAQRHIRSVVEERWQTPDWITPQVLSLAQVAYDERPGRECEQCLMACMGRGVTSIPDCAACRGTGRVEGAVLDPLTLAVLADALEEAGASEPCPHCKGEGYCQTGAHRFDAFGRKGAPQRIRCVACEGTGRLPSSLVAHLRSPGPHVRGCWALDLILGKE